MAITIPNVFVAGTRIESAPVNANFAAMTNALDKTGDTITGNMVVGTGITIDGLDISTVPQTGGTFNPNSIVFTNVILGAATTAGIRLDLESGTLAVREGDDSAYGPMLASVYNVPTGGSINFNAGSAALTWDTTESTANLALSASVDHKIGTQELVRCVNRTGTAIAKGKAVYIVGAHGNRPEIALADASDEATAATTLGITAESIADTAEGFVCVTGMLRGLNTNHLTEGQIVWLSETAGELTSTRPTQPAHGVFMGLCVRQQPGTSGILYVSVVNGLELEELHDVLITTPSANQILKRNSGNTLWVNSSGTALTKTDDTNVTLTLGGSASTALVNAASLTLGWTGTLAAGRLNSNVVQAITNDTNVTGSISAQTLTLGWTGQLAVWRGGTGASTLTGYVKGSGTAALTASSTIPNTDITGLGTLSTQNASSVSISGGSITGITDLAIADGGTGASTAQAALNTLAGAVTSGQYLRGNGTNVVMSAIQVSDVPTLNQNTTGTAAGLSSTLAVSSGGTGQTSYTDGQLLIGNSVGNTLTKATLTAGSNITITNGNGTITIAAPTGGGTVTSVGGTGTVNGITLTGSVTTSGNLTLGGTLSGVNLTSQVTGTLPLANGGTGQTTAQAAINSLAGATTSGQYLRGNGTNVVMSGIQAGDVPTLNQNTTGTAANVTGVVAAANGGTGQTSVQAAMNSLAGATTSGQYLRGNGTNVVMSAIQAGDVPTLNQNTTGTAAGLSATLAVSSGGTGQTSYTDGQLLIGNSATSSLSKTTLSAGSGVTIVNGNGTITIAATGSGGTITVVGATSPVLSSGGATPVISLDAAYGDTLNPYGSKTANYVLAAPNGSAGTPSFRALVAADIPTLNQNTTGTAAGLSSTLAVASGGTGQTTYTDGELLIGNSTGNTLTKATLTAGTGVTVTNAAGAITISATGTGGTVTSVSGTGSASGLSLSGTVTTTGDLTLSGTVDSMSALAGSASAPSIAASGDTNTGIFFPAADTLAVTTGGTERLRIDSSGNVGIGTTPSAFLGSRVIQLDRMSVLGYANTGFVSTNVYTDGSWKYIAAATATQYWQSDGTHVWRSGGTGSTGAAVSWVEQARLALSGAFILGSGEGSATPTGNTFRATSGTGTNITGGTLTIEPGNGTGTGGSGLISFRTAAAGTAGTSANTMAERLRIDSTGRTIIYGTSTQQYPLLVGQTTSTSAAFLFFNNASGQFYIGNENSAGNAAGAGSGAAYARTIWGEGAYPMVFGTNNAERMRLDASGNLGLGVTPSAWGATAKAFEQPAGAVASISTTQHYIMQNLAFIGGSWLYKDSAAASFYRQQAGAHAWITVPSGTAGATALLTTTMLLDASGNLAIGAAAKFYLDGTAATGDTYLHESSANNLSFVTGGTERLRLTSSGDTAIPATAKLLLDGVAGTGDTYLTESSANNISIFTGGTEQLRITSGGFVGIGTTSPSASLEIASNTDGNMYIGRYTTDAFSPSLVVRKARGTVASPAAIATNDFLGSYLFQGFGGTNWRSLAQVYAYASNYTSDTNITSYLGFSTTNAGSSSTERFRIAGNGDVSIGATAKLFLDGVGGGDTYLTESSANNLSIFTGGTERVTIDSTGEVGIGVTAPGAVLDIARDAAVGGRITRYSTDASSPTWALRKARGTQASPTAVAVSDDIATLAFSAYGGTTFSDVASIKATMNRVASNTDMGVDITIGSANAGTSALPKLKIAGNDVAFPTTGRMFFDMNPTTGAITGNTGIVWNGGSNQIVFHTGGAARFSVANGGVGIAATAKIWLDGTTLAGDTYLTETSANQIAIFTGGSERLRLDGSGNVGINVTAFGTSAAGVLGLKNGTEPSTGPADTVQIYSVDRSAGNTIPGIRCEGTGVTDAGITDTTVTNKIAIKINGTVYYLLATTNAT